MKKGPLHRYVKRRTGSMVSSGCIGTSNIR